MTPPLGRKEPSIILQIPNVVPSTQGELGALRTVVRRDRESLRKAPLAAPESARS
jgi:hypothetical protein